MTQMNLDTIKNGDRWRKILWNTVLIPTVGPVWNNLLTMLDLEYNHILLCHRALTATMNVVANENGDRWWEILLNTTLVLRVMLVMYGKPN
jgi:hypothetical protein